MKKIKKKKSKSPNSVKKKKKKSSKKKSKKKKKSSKNGEETKENLNENIASKNNFQTGQASPVKNKEKSQEPVQESEPPKSPSQVSVKNKSQEKDASEEKRSEEAKEREKKREQKLNSLMTFGQANYKRDCTKNTSWFDTQDKKTKIKIRIVIPDYIGPHLQRKDNLLGRIESTHGCKLAFVADTETRVSTCEGIKGRLVQFAGKVPQVMSAMQGLLEEIIRTEQELNGKRKS